MNIIFKFCLSLFCIALFADITVAQDLSKIGEKPFWKQAKISGGIGGSMVGYNTKGQESQRPPFYWVVNANINIDVYGMAIPFSATFTSQNQDFAQPFNQFCRFFAKVEKQITIMKQFIKSSHLCPGNDGNREERHFRC